MTSTPPYIIVTNDDGVQAPGILALAQAMRTFARIAVIAPSVNQSSSGHKKTLFQDIAYTAVTLADGTPATSIAASPADCIAVAALDLIEWPPALVISGINRGGNMGQDITSSGTVTAALEATLAGVPALAVSLDRRDADNVEDYAEAGRLAAIIAQRMIEKPIPAFTILNLNVPHVERVRGLRLTRQGVRIYQETLERGDGVCRLVGPPPSGKFDVEGTDIWAVHRGYASLTPLHLDLTAHPYLAELGAWDLQL